MFARAGTPSRRSLDVRRDRFIHLLVMVAQGRNGMLAQVAERSHRRDQRLPFPVLDSARGPRPDQERNWLVVGRELVAELLDLTPRSWDTMRASARG